MSVRGLCLDCRINHPREVFAIGPQRHPCAGGADVGRCGRIGGVSRLANPGKRSTDGGDKVGEFVCCDVVVGEVRSNISATRWGSMVLVSGICSLPASAGE
jgi:hypothetical protein